MFKQPGDKFSLYPEMTKNAKEYALWMLCCIGELYSFSR